MTERTAQRDRSDRGGAVDEPERAERHDGEQFEPSSGEAREAPSSRARSRRSKTEARPQREKPQADKPAKEDRDSDDEEETSVWTSFRDTVREHPYATAAVAIAILLVLAAAFIWWLSVRDWESTDDAFIDARLVPISSQISGAIVDLPVTDNQIVKAGGALLKIDPSDYQANLDQAKAQVEQGDATIANLAAQIDAQAARIEQAKRQVTEAKGALDFAQQENARFQDLAKTGAGTVERAQQTQSDLTQRKAAYDAAVADQSAEEKQIAVLRTQAKVAAAQRDQAKAQVELAQANLARTVIMAPVDGLVTKLTAAVGAYVQPGQTVMMFVPSQVWITANYKETQLTQMRPGQPVDISIDAYPGRTFKGHVDSIQAGSGAAFALLPPENATGNYVKVVQRVPVKIVFDGPLGVYVGPGMSVVPSVKVQ